VRQSLIVREVVHRDDLDVGGACGVLNVHRTEEVSADTPKAVHAHPDSHCDLLVVLRSAQHRLHATSSLTALGPEQQRIRSSHFRKFRIGISC
jgi:hypothetical protein